MSSLQEAVENWLKNHSPHGSAETVVDGTGRQTGDTPMLDTNTPVTLKPARAKRHTMKREDWADIRYWFKAEPRMVAMGDGSYRYLHGLTDESVAELLKDKVPGITSKWVAKVRRDLKMPFHVVGHVKQPEKKVSKRDLLARLEKLERQMEYVLFSFNRKSNPAG